MTLPYDPSDWYWRAEGENPEDVRVFGSAAQGLVEPNDPDFLGWLQRGGIPTVWPRDAEGARTQAALDAVLVAASATQPIVTYKLDFYRRMTDAEADAVEMALAGAKVRDRRIFEEAQLLNHADADFARLRETVVGMFGDARAAEMLAPSAAA